MPTAGKDIHRVGWRMEPEVGVLAAPLLVVGPVHRVPPLVVVVHRGAELVCQLHKVGVSVEGEEQLGCVNQADRWEAWYHEGER